MKEDKKRRREPRVRKRIVSVAERTDREEGERVTTRRRRLSFSHAGRVFGVSLSSPQEPRRATPCQLRKKSPFEKKKKVGMKWR
jgi:hypothetical protein